MKPEQLISRKLFEQILVDLKTRGRLEIALVSGSMSPVLPAGGRATIEPCRMENLKALDLVVFWDPDEKILLCHALLAKGVFRSANGEKTIYTQGIQNRVGDHPVRESNILGRVDSHQITHFQFWFYNRVAAAKHFLRAVSGRGRKL